MWHHWEPGAQLLEQEALPHKSVRPPEQSHGEGCPSKSGQHCQRSNPKSDKPE